MTFLLVWLPTLMTKCFGIVFLIISDTNIVDLATDSQCRIKSLRDRS